LSRASPGFVKDVAGSGRRASNSNHEWRSACRPKTAPETEDEVLVNAKQLAHDDGRVWDTEDLEDAPAARDRIADASLRAEYLNRARELLRHEKI
jgi:hypothetical protein